MLIVKNLDVIGFIFEQARRPVQLQTRIGIGLARELLVDLIEVVVVDVNIAASPDKFTDLEVDLLGDHVRQQCVTGDVEGNSQKQISGSLIQLAREFAIRDVKLKQGVARRERHAGNIGNIPGRNDDAARIGIGAQRL